MLQPTDEATAVSDVENNLITRQKKMYKALTNNEHARHSLKLLDIPFPEVPADTRSPFEKR